MPEYDHDDLNHLDKNIDDTNIDDAHRHFHHCDHNDTDHDDEDHDNADRNDVHRNDAHRNADSHPNNDGNRDRDFLNVDRHEHQRNQHDITYRDHDLRKSNANDNCDDGDGYGNADLHQDDQHGDNDKHVLRLQRNVRVEQHRGVLCLKDKVVQGARDGQGGEPLRGCLCRRDLPVRILHRLHAAGCDQILQVGLQG